VKRPP